MKRIHLLALLCLLLIAGTAQAQSRVGIKTNLLYDATATINLGVEVGLAQKLSLDVSGNLNPWTWKNNMMWKHWMLQPELRFWTCHRFNGHFFGVHALAARYNIGNIPLSKDFRFLGVHYGALADNRFEGFGVGAGVAYGYAHPLGDHWNLEAEIGLGAVYGIANAYAGGNSDELVARAVRKFTPMVTKAAVSIVYLF
ncbi:MAG: DUF3575 domain-containing protein [Bacteroidales bacterium]|nr:DUF3575 domain-containing protein [Bacteroidales bacterium]